MRLFSATLFYGLVLNFSFALVQFSYAVDTEKKDENSFEMLSLPSEVLSKIATHLSPSSLSDFTCVNQVFNGTANDTVLYQYKKLDRSSLLKELEQVIKRKNLLRVKVILSLL